MIKLVVGWRNDLNWYNAHFRIPVSADYPAQEVVAQAFALASSLSGVHPNRIGMVEEKADVLQPGATLPGMTRDRHLPFWNGSEFVYTCIGIYALRPRNAASEGRACGKATGGQWRYFRRHVY